MIRNTAESAADPYYATELELNKTAAGCLNFVKHSQPKGAEVRATDLALK